MGKEAKKLRKCFKAYTQHGFANEIARLIQENTKQLKVQVQLWDKKIVGLLEHTPFLILTLEAPFSR